MFGVSRLTPSLTLPLPWPWRFAALLLVVLGVATAVSGALTFRRQHTTLNPTTPGAASVLVSSGIFRYTRNPMYLGLLIVLVGIAVSRSNPTTLLFLVAFVLYLTRFQIMPEERALLAKFGSQYADYMSTVRRWV